MRRQFPRASPSWTREFGPIDATRRERLLASARTTTQSREIELTHRVVRRVFDADGGAAFVDATTRGLAATGGGACTVGAGAGGSATSFVATTRVAGGSAMRVTGGSAMRVTGVSGLLSRTVVSAGVESARAIGAWGAGVLLTASVCASAVSAASGGAAFFAAVFACSIAESSDPSS